MESGVAVSETDSARSEGPVSSGMSVPWTPHAAVSATAARARKRKPAFMALLIPKVAKVNLNRAGHADFVADPVGPVEGHVSDRRDHPRVVLQLRQRRLLLRHVANDFETNEGGRPRVDGHGGGAIERKRHVDAWRVASIGAPVSHAVPRQGHRVIAGRPDNARDVLHR